MNFNIYPDRGFLNTYFGFKLFDHNPNNNFRFVFSDGSSTEWISENTLIYKQFLRPGEQTIVLETETERIEKTILIENSIKLGNGKTINIFFPENDNIIIQRKSTGIVVYYKHLGNKISKDILPKEIWNWDESQLLFFTKSIKKTKFPKGKFGFFDFEVSEFTEEFDGTFIHYSQCNRKIIFHQEDKIFIRYPDKETVTIAGEFLEIDNTNSFLFFKKDNIIKQFQIAENKTINIGEYEFYELTESPNLIVLIRDDLYLIWDTKKVAFIEKGISNDYSIYSDGTILKYKQEEILFEINFNNSKTKIEKTRREIFENRLSEDKKYLIRSSSLKYFQLFTVAELDKDVKIIRYNFKDVLIADLIKIEELGKIKIYSLHKNKIEFNGEGEIICGFKKDGKTYIVIKNGKEVSFFSYVTTLMLIQKYPGDFDIKYLDKLINYSNLWIKVSSKNFQIFNSITTDLLKEINIKEIISHWVLTEDKKFVNTITLEEIDSNFDNYYSVNSSLTKGIIHKADGFYLVKIQDNDFTETKIFDSDLFYTKCDVHPEGKIAILSHEGMTEFLDLETFDKIEVPDTSFLRFDNRGKVILNSGTNNNINPRIFDPITFKEIPQESFVYFKHFSPDGTLKSNHSIEITQSGKRLTILSHPSDIESKLLMKSNPNYVNFLSFSPQNNFIAYAGKVSWSNGVVELFKVEHSNYSVTLVDSKVFLTGKAIWRCVFSTDNKYLGFYTSDTITYIVALDTAFVPTSTGPRVIYSRSIECFSPDSLFVVLSQHRYDAITLGGVGWIPSSKIFINEIMNLTELLELDEHNTQVVFANFSSNGKKLISRSDDGIVLIRNFDYEKLVESKTEFELRQTVDN